MHSILISKQEGSLRYKVFFDQDGYYNDFDEQSKVKVDFESQEEKEREMKKFHEGDLGHFGVVKEVACNCCKGWSLQDSLWGIVADCPENALKHYLEHVGA